MMLQSRFSKFSNKEIERLLKNSVPAKTKKATNFGNWNGTEWKSGYSSQVSNVLESSLNLIKQLFHSRLLHMRLVIANEAPHWLSIILYATHAHGIIV
mgnify:CR=1 FL=1